MKKYYSVVREQSPSSIDHELSRSNGCGFSEQVGNGARNVYTRALQVPSVAQTGRLPGVVFLHIGMRVRMTTQVLAPWAVRDTTGVIMEIQAAPADLQKFQRQSNQFVIDQFMHSFIDRLMVI